MDDLISRQAAIDALDEIEAEVAEGFGFEYEKWRKYFCDLPPAQPERTVYANMSDEQFERWLYEHGICHPDIHKPIQCSEVPLLIDAAINELPSAASEAHVIKLRMDIDKNAFLEAWKAAQKDITFLPPENDGWIPVTERLPEEGVMVLVTCYGRDMIIMRDGESLEDAIERVRKEVVNVTVGLVGSDGWYGADYSPMIITPAAWMPLPDPWKGKEE